MAFPDEKNSNFFGAESLTTFPDFAPSIRLTSKTAGLLVQPHRKILTTSMNSSSSNSSSR